MYYVTIAIVKQIVYPTNLKIENRETI